jgi:hypothetical protein
MIGVYLAHPYSAGSQAIRAWNRANTLAWCVWLAEHGFSPSANWLLLVNQLEETPENREIGLACDVDQVERQDVFLAVGRRVSDGMRREMSAARESGVPVVDATGTSRASPYDLSTEQEENLCVALRAAARVVEARRGEASPPRNTELLTVLEPR